MLWCFSNFKTHIEIPEAYRSLDYQNTPIRVSTEDVFVLLYSVSVCLNDTRAPALVRSTAERETRSVSSSFSRLSGQEVLFLFDRSDRDGLAGQKADTTGSDERQC